MPGRVRPKPCDPGHGPLGGVGTDYRGLQEHEVGALRMSGSEAGLPGSIALRAGAVAISLLLATLAAAVLEQWAGVVDASPVYLVPVVIAAALFGTWAAIGTSFAGFLVYDFLFTTPRFSLQVSDPAEWLSLLLYLIVAVVIGRFTALLRDRADEADRRVREGVALVAMSRDVAMTTSFEEAAAEIALRLLVDAEMDVVWVTRLDGSTAAWAGSDVPERTVSPWTLMRSAQDTDSDWLRLHVDGEVATDEGAQHYRVAILADQGEVGWIHATRKVGDPRPGRGARRLLVLAADQLGIALRRDELRAELTAVEVTRQSDALRAAILDSVSHDLRTPIASIRALAGGLADATAEFEPAAVRSTAVAIDAEAERLGNLVNSLLDMGRIQAGALRPDLRPYDLADLVETTLRDHPADPGRPRPAIRIPDDLPPVLVDAVLFDVALGNVVDNAALHASPDAVVRLTASITDGDLVLLAVDDAGPGVSADAMPYLFDRFYRVPAGQEQARRGMGMGLAIARGFVEAMAGTIEAEPSPLGGLGIRIRLVTAPDALPE
jgi:two-component system sensor histidine kinase KdpD